MTEQLLLLVLLLLFGRHKQDALGVVALRRSDPRTVRDQLGGGTGVGQGGHAGRMASLRHVAHRAEPLERFRRGRTFGAVVVRDAVAGRGQLLQVLVGPGVRRPGQQQFAVLAQSIEKWRRAGVRTGDVAVVTLGLGVRRLLLVVVHGLLVVRPAVLLQPRLGQPSVVLTEQQSRQARGVVAAAGGTCLVLPGAANATVGVQMVLVHRCTAATGAAAVVAVQMIVLN